MAIREVHYRVGGPVRGHFPGHHRSTRGESGFEFRGHAPLLDAPDPRRLDLHASLRDPFGQWRVRVYRQRMSVPVAVVADLSASMGFAASPPKLHVLADFGTLVFYNIHAPKPERDVFAEMCAVSKKTPALRCFNIHTYDADPVRRKRLTREVIALLANGTIKPRIGARLPLAQAAMAHQLLEDGSVLGKIILHP